jgi:hypothetical protein
MRLPTMITGGPARPQGDPAYLSELETADHANDAISRVANSME